MCNFKDNYHRVSRKSNKSFFKLKGDKLRFATDKIEKMISLRQAA